LIINGSVFEKNFAEHKVNTTTMERIEFSLLMRDFVVIVYVFQRITIRLITISNITVNGNYPYRLRKNNNITFCANNALMAIKKINRIMISNYSDGINQLVRSGKSTEK
jgi:hypothetical protein